jgi:phospholipase/carboxylesterase
MGHDALMRRHLSRRTWLAGLAGLAFAPAVAAQTARLRARPSTDVADPLPPGLHKIKLIGGRVAQLLIPAKGHGAPQPFMTMLHGSDQHAETAIRMVHGEAERAGVVVLATQSSGRTWDIRGLPNGDDAVTLDAAMAAAFARVAVDPTRVASAGFSDGATYALSLGLMNGDLFSDLLAFSVGGLNAPVQVGKPRVFFSHGRQDWVLDYKYAHKLSEELKTSGYDVEFYSFNGSHDLPLDALNAGLKRLLR